ncbi:MAG: hypothetical protein QOG84_2813 [Sphingomonadales bacterium]|jgi:microcystin-dependent protein|nr:hypothetical protein [Sphingomonadales bacterium]
MADSPSPLAVGIVRASPPSLALTPLVQLYGAPASESRTADEATPGTVRLFAAAYEPWGAALADGRELAASDYPALPACGAVGDAASIALPDLRGRAAVGAAPGAAAADLGPTLPMTYLIAAVANSPGSGAAPFIGMIAPYIGNEAPPGWLPADGRLLPITDYVYLFGLLGTCYGGDGKTDFALPDLRGRAPVGIPTAFGTSATGRLVGDIGTGVYYLICAEGPYPTRDQPSGALAASALFLGEVVASAAQPNQFLEGITLMADGSVLQIADFPDLHSVIGNLFGGDGVTTFAVPDLRGRMVVGAT